MFSLSDKGRGGRRLSDCRIGHSRLGRAVDPRLLGGICIPVSRLSHDTELLSAICVKRGRLRHSLGLGIVQEMGLKWCKWASMNAPSIESPPSHSVMGL